MMFRFIMQEKRHDKGSISMNTGEDFRCTREGTKQKARYLVRECQIERERLSYKCLDRDKWYLLQGPFTALLES